MGMALLSVDKAVSEDKPVVSRSELTLFDAKLLYICTYRGSALSESTVGVDLQESNCSLFSYLVF